MYNAMLAAGRFLRFRYCFRPHSRGLGMQSGRVGFLVSPASLVSIVTLSFLAT